MDDLAAWLTVLWVGGLWITGYLVAPVLFSMLSDRVQAGAVAGRLFYIMGWVGLGAGAYLGLFMMVRLHWRLFAYAVFWVWLIMLILTGVMQFGIQPFMNALKMQAGPDGVMNSALHGRFSAWHGVSSILYLIQSLLGLALIRGLNKLTR